MRENTEETREQKPRSRSLGVDQYHTTTNSRGCNDSPTPPSCVSFSQLHFDNDIYLKPNPPTLFFPSSFLATASVVPRGWCTHQPPFRRDRQLGACDELNYTRSKFDISLSLSLSLLSLSVIRRFNYFSPPILATGETCRIFCDQHLILLLFGMFISSLRKVETEREI